MTKGVERRDGGAAQEQSEVSADTERRDAREAQEQSDVSAGADARDIREAERPRAIGSHRRPADRG